MSLALRHFQPSLHVVEPSGVRVVTASQESSQDRDLDLRCGEVMLVDGVAQPHVVNVKALLELRSQQRGLDPRFVRRAGVARVSETRGRGLEGAHRFEAVLWIKRRTLSMVDGLAPKVAAGDVGRRR